MRTKIKLSLSIILISCSILYSQQREGFTIEKLIESTPVKNQQSSGTCWSHATTSFIETEAIRMGKKLVILSPFFYVHPTYISKAERYIRLQGNGYFADGDLTFSVMDAYRKYGAIPETIYSGLIDNETRHDDTEMQDLLQAMVKSIATSEYGRIKQNSWRKTIQEALNSYLGPLPDSFNYNSKSYTSQSFADEYIGINPDNYIEITSYNHHPFNNRFILEIPANWNNNFYLNLTIQDLHNVIDNAIRQGYSLCWDGDVTESGFDDEKGLADIRGIYENEKAITQEMRQYTFNNYTTRDDHNMHLIGVAMDKDGKKYYILKNSYGTDNDGLGYIYMSENYLLLKTISVMVHRDAIPHNIKLKCKIE
jgi:bleomycin hydrolase